MPAAGVVSYTDGNGARNAARVPVAGQPSVLVRHDGVVTAFLTIAASSGAIDELMWVLNTDKLTRFAPAEERSLLHQLPV